MKRFEAFLLGCDRLFKLGDAAVLQLCRLIQVTLLTGPLEFEFCFLELFFGGPHLLDLFLLGMPLRLHRGRFLVQVGDPAFDVLKAFFRFRIGFTRQRLPFDLELEDLAFQFVDLLGERIDRDADARSGLIDQIDRFVWKKAVRYVAI